MCTTIYLAGLDDMILNTFIFASITCDFLLPIVLEHSQQNPCGTFPESFHRRVL